MATTSTAELNEKANKDVRMANGVFVYPNELGALNNNDYLHYMVIRIYERADALRIDTSNLAGDAVSNIDNSSGTATQRVAAIEIDPTGTPQNSNIGSISGGTAKSSNSIVLYLPPNITVDYTPSWGNQEIGIVGAAADRMGAVWNAATDMSNPNALNDAFKALAPSAATTSTVGLLTAGSIAEGVGIQGAKGLSEKGLGAILNPYSEVTFTGMGNRQFNFQFKFLPQSKKEAETVRSIIKLMKFHAVPSLQGAAVMVYPSEFHISFWRIQKTNNNGVISFNTSENEHLFKMDMCACTQVQVNYSPTGNMRTFEDGMPVEIDMTLGFTEMTVMTKEKINKGY